MLVSADFGVLAPLRRTGWVLGVVAISSVALACSPRRTALTEAGRAAPRMSTGFGQAADTGRDLEFEGGWLVARTLLVASDGTRSLGDADSPVNTTRDRGSKIVFFDPRVGNNETAEVYWWNGREIVDARGRPANDAGARYGDDPLQPNLAAIRPFEAA